MLQRNYGWEKDKPDARDFGYSRHIGISDAYLPRQVSNTKWCPRAWDQGQASDCVAHALAAAAMYLYARSDLSAPEMSRLFPYWTTRVLVEHQTPDTDGGCQIRDGIKALMRYGCCLETTWPYDLTKLAAQPPIGAFIEGSHLRLQKALRCTSTRAVRHGIAAGYPVVLGFDVPEVFESAEVEHSGVLPPIEPDEKIVGGHCVLGVGYDIAREATLCLNSYGPKWGLNGYFWLPDDRINADSDAWVVLLEEFKPQSHD